MPFAQQLRHLYNYIFKPQFFAGTIAEDRFAYMAGKKGWVLEKIPLDRSSFTKYANNASNYIKRGDFLVRNLRNLEVEVKCFTLHGQNGNSHYNIPYSHIKRHQEMVKMTGQPVIFAIFERRGRHPVGKTLRMIALRDLTGKPRRGIHYNERIKCVEVPTGAMSKGFACFDRYKSRLARL